MRSKDERVEANPIIREVFVAEGTINESFTFEGPRAYENGILDITIKAPTSKTWEEIPISRYELLTTALGFHFINGYFVPENTLVKIVYISPEVAITTMPGTTLPIQQIIPEEPVSGTIVVGAIATAVDTGIVLNGIIVLADHDNDDSVYIGPSTVTVGNGYRLEAGESCPVPASDLSEIFAIAVSAGDKIHYIGG